MKWSMSENQQPAVPEEARWFARRRDPATARHTEDAFQTWLAADPENAVRYGQCELAWERTLELSPDPDIGAWLDALDAKVDKTPQLQPATLLGALPHRSGNQTRQRKRVLRSPAFWAAAATVLLTAGILTARQFTAPVYQTAVGEQRDVLLPDGSRITLNTATRVVVKYTSTLRRLELTAGEALFDVQKDPARPFEVAAGTSVARALGTRFAVERTGNAVTVSVLDGIVEVVKGNAKTNEQQRILPALEGGQAASVVGEARTATLSAANIRRIQAWQDRKIDFEGEPLDKAIAEVNRYANKHLVLGQPQLAELRISGVFRIAALEGFVFALHESFGLRIVENGEELLVLPGARTAAPAHAASENAIDSVTDAPAADKTSTN